MGQLRLRVADTPGNETSATEGLPAVILYSIGFSTSLATWVGTPAATVTTGLSRGFYQVKRL